MRFRSALTMAARMALALGLLLTGWGWDDPRGFFAHPALVVRSWLVAPIFLASLCFVGSRILGEEKLLGEHFGSEFEAYRQRTWRLVPYLY